MSSPARTKRKVEDSGEDNTIHKKERHDEDSNSADNALLASIIRVADFAAVKHRSQRRKDKEKTPYINHPIGVAKLIVDVGGVTDFEVLAAALLHDTVEDTDTTIEEISSAFGANVASIVAEVTDNKSLSKRQRKEGQIAHAPHISAQAKTVKLADKLYNLSSLQTSVPTSWDRERYVMKDKIGRKRSIMLNKRYRVKAQGYFVWASHVVEGMRGTNAGLEAALDEVFSGTFSDPADGETAVATLPPDREQALQQYLTAMDQVND